MKKLLGDTGLESEYASHYRIGALSGGQKVKVVLAAAMGPTSYLFLMNLLTILIEIPGALAGVDRMKVVLL